MYDWPLACLVIKLDITYVKMSREALVLAAQSSESQLDRAMPPHLFRWWIEDSGQITFMSLVVTVFGYDSVVLPSPGCSLRLICAKIQLTPGHPGSVATSSSFLRPHSWAPFQVAVVCPFNDKIIPVHVWTLLVCTVTHITNLQLLSEVLMVLSVSSVTSP